MNAPLDLPLSATYARLPEAFWARVDPTPVAEPQMLRLNRPLAQHLGLDPGALDGPAGAEIFAGNRVPEGAEPIAMAYAGHQFGHFVPSLGDGRAILLGEVVGADGVRRDLHLKGAGQTPFSRRGDGRAVLGPVLREYVVSEAMHALGIPTTRALAMVATGEPVYRDGPEPGAILARVARSHVRVGTFEYFARRGDTDAVRTLADYVIDRHLPDLKGAEGRHLGLFEHAILRQAELVAKWMQVGFIHGVMNTDNTSVIGETIDYGPCAFMDTYDPRTVFSSIDHGGRYAYHQQPKIAHWNLCRLGECLLPLFADSEEAAIEIGQGALDAFPPRFEAAYLDGFRAKIGLAEGQEGDQALLERLLTAMLEQKADFTNTFRALSDLDFEREDPLDAVRAELADRAALDGWLGDWRARLDAEGRGGEARRAAMRAVNPAYIPRNHRVQEAIDAAVRGDLGPTDELFAAVTAPFEDRPEGARLARPPEAHEIVHQTFCGT